MIFVYQFDGFQVCFHPPMEINRSIKKKRPVERGTLVVVAWLMMRRRFYHLPLVLLLMVPNL